MFKASLAYLKIIVVLSLLLIQSLQAAQIDHLELKEADIRDAARILSSLTGANITVTQAASNATVDLLLQNVSLEHAVETVARITGLWYRRSQANNSFIIMTKGEYQSDIVVYRKDGIRSFTLKHQNVRATALTIQSLFGERVILKQLNQQDDFDGLPDDFRKKGSLTVSSSGSNSRSNRSSSSASNSSAEIDTIARDKQSFARVRQQLEGDLNDGVLRRIQENGSLNSGSNTNLGIQTPIFIATNRIHNLIHVRTSDNEAMSEIAALIRTSDRPTPQVLLETKIIQIDDSNEDDRGFSFDFDDSDTRKLAVNSQVTRLGLAATTGGFYEFFSKHIRLKIEALERNRAAKIIARPILLASNNRPARIFIGEQQVIAVGTKSIPATFDIDKNILISSSMILETKTKDIGNTLSILPSINSDGTVTLDIQQTTTRLKRKGMSFPYMSESKIKTHLLDTVEESSLRTIAVAKNGLTIALGGSILDSTRDEGSQVPVLASIPLLGEMFKNSKKAKSKSQFIMLITPHVILSPHQGASASEKIKEIKSQIARRDIAVTRPAKPSKQAIYHYLSRYAAKAAHNRRPKDRSVEAVALSNKPAKVLENPNISSIAIASYRQDRLYISVLELRNNSDQSQPINLQTLRGRWLSAAREQPFLAAKGTTSGGMNDSSYLYLISPKPLADVVGIFK